MLGHRNRPVEAGRTEKIRGAAAQGRAGEETLRGKCGDRRWEELVRLK